MHIDEAQRQLRSAFLGGFAGQMVSGVIWLASGAAAVWGTTRMAILVLVVGGFFIFPLTQAGLRLMGRSGRVPEENALGGLGAQVAFVVPLCLPLVAAATMHRLEWFYPAFMVAVGAHYLPFVFLYGMRMFAVLGAVLWVGGFMLARDPTMGFSVGAWITGGVLVTFAVIGRHLVLREETAVAAHHGTAT